MSPQLLSCSLTPSLLHLIHLHTLLNWTVFVTLKPAPDVLFSLSSLVSTPPIDQWGILKSHREYFLLVCSMLFLLFFFSSSLTLSFSNISHNRTFLSYTLMLSFHRQSDKFQLFTNPHSIQLKHLKIAIFFQHVVDRTALTEFPVCANKRAWNVIWWACMRLCVCPRWMVRLLLGI